ncbi:MAG: hypothetical protein ABGZ35_19815 [Planctomycetaceae bacterium]
MNAEDGGSSVANIRLSRLSQSLIVHDQHGENDAPELATKPGRVARFGAHLTQYSSVYEEGLNRVGEQTVNATKDIENMADAGSGAFKADTVVLDVLAPLALLASGLALGKAIKDQHDNSKSINPNFREEFKDIPNNKPEKVALQGGIKHVQARMQQGNKSAALVAKSANFARTTMVTSSVIAGGVGVALGTAGHALPLAGVGMGAVASGVGFGVACYKYQKGVKREAQLSERAKVLKEQSKDAGLDQVQSALKDVNDSAIQQTKRKKDGAAGEMTQHLVVGILATLFGVGAILATGGLALVFVGCALAVGLGSTTASFVRIADEGKLKKEAESLKSRAYAGEKLQPDTVDSSKEARKVTYRGYAGVRILTHELLKPNGSDRSPIEDHLRKTVMPNDKYGDECEAMLLLKKIVASDLDDESKKNQVSQLLEIHLLS